MKMRARWVQPETFTHGRLYDLETRLGMPVIRAFIGLWCACDREGRFVWKPRELQRVILPYDRDADMAVILDALADDGFVVQYAVGAHVFGWVPRFAAHQFINAKETASVIPAPPAAVVAAWQSLVLAQNFGAKPERGRDGGASAGSSTATAMPGAGVGTAREVAEETGSDFSATSASDHGVPSVSSSNGNALRDTSRVDDASVTGAITRGSRETKTESKSSSREGEGREGQEITTGREARPPRARARIASDARPGDPDANGGHPGGEPGTALVPVVPQRIAALRGRGGALVAVPVTAPGVLPFDDGGSAQALPAIRGKRDAHAIVARLAQVHAELEAGTRKRLHADQQRTVQAELVFAYWQKRYDHPKALLDERREKVIVRALKANKGNVSELLYALDGALRDAWVKENNDDVAFVLRDRANVEKYANKIPAYRADTLHPTAVKYAAAIGGGDVGTAGDDEQPVLILDRGDT